MRILIVAGDCGKKYHNLRYAHSRTASSLEFEFPDGSKRLLLKDRMKGAVLHSFEDSRDNALLNVIRYTIIHRFDYHCGHPLKWR